MKSELECESEEKKPEVVLPLSLSHSLWFFVHEMIGLSNQLWLDNMLITIKF